NNVMFSKGKSSVVPSDGQAREKLALYVYEYLLHIGAQKSAQTFLSEIRWEKNITLGEPPGFLHSWWCVFWDLYCAAPERRETCEHSSEAKAFHDYVSCASTNFSGFKKIMYSCSALLQGPPGSQASPHSQPPPPNSMMGPHGQSFMSPRFPGGPRPPIRMGNQPPGGVPAAQPMLPNMDPMRMQGGPMQRMSNPRGMGPMGPGPQNFGGGMRPPHNAVGPGMPGMNMGPGGGRPPWPNPNSNNNVSYSINILNTAGMDLQFFCGMLPPLCYSMQFPIAPGSEGPLGAMAGMDPLHLNGGNSVFSDVRFICPQNSPNNLSGMSNPPGTPRDDDVGGSYLHSFQNESYSPSMTMSV
uniref:LisH domain-containing protein n=1 Tax=Denticeps clupeoides TaxID=299321 RepID=A0AAY4BDW0_9TELE